MYLRTSADNEGKSRDRGKRLGGRSRRVLRVAGTVAALGIVSALPAGCSLGDRAKQADRIVASVALLHRGDAAGAVSVALRRGSGLPTAPTAAGAATPPSLNPAAASPVPVAELALTLEVAKRRAAMRLIDPSATSDLIVFDDTASYVNRVAASASERQWALLDFRDLSSKTKPSIQGVVANAGPPMFGLLNPVHVVELLNGVLTGSVRSLPATKVDGETLQHYKANLSLDDAERGLRLAETARDARRQALRVLAITGDILPAEVWLDAAGHLRRMQVTLKQHPTRRIEIDVLFTISLKAAGAVPAVVVPDPATVLSVDSTTELVRPLRIKRATP